MGRLGQLLNSTAGLSICLLILTLAGAYIFNKVEGTAEIRTRIQAAKARQRIFVLAQELADEGDDADWSKLVAQVDKYRNKLLQAWKAGNDELGAGIKPPSWSFWGSLYYCITLFTTIGYGNVFPSTTTGRIVTVCYGLIAIPLCSMVINRISKAIARLLKAIYLMTLDTSGIPIGLRDAYHRAGTDFDFSLITSFGLLVIYAIFSGVVYCWGIGETASAWSPLDAVYFAFISITSIGLGDIVPSSDVFLNLASLAYIFVGLALMNLFFTRLIQLTEAQLERIGGSATDVVGASQVGSGNQMQSRYALGASGRFAAGALADSTTPNYH
ncbi:TWiK family of potassium channels protein 7 [Echinococcus multilocularis]|uniref:TWiK family of potassium channels protein 7 n=1 Tax=Echinococcus multilocularis TaxID=6211 RepID=A0A087VYF5_ECHMU|nr:TWiK family of potassium channels protein 7 [Echinococcus multilocularis]